MANLLIHCEDVEFTLPNHSLVITWIENVVLSKNCAIEEINFIFCSDDYLLSINQEYLHHDYYTDIITFDHSEEDTTLAADIYISIDRVNENAMTLKVSFLDELHRVMIHGVLHLLGLDDKSESEKTEMRKIEDHYLALREF